jgi:signal transduction histidine kinase
MTRDGDPARTVTTPPEPDPFLAHPLPRWLLDRRHRLRRLDQRHPWVADTAAVLAVLLFSLPQLIGGGGTHRDALDGTHSPLVVLTCAALLLIPLWWRRRAPMLTFVVVLAVVLAEWSAGVWLSTDVALLVALYGVAARRSMRALAWAAGGTAGAVSFSIFAWRPGSEHRLAVLLLILGTCSAGVAAGLAVRTLRAYLTALADRTAWLETERDQRALLAAAAERARVAREMHDLVGHHVSVIVGLADGGATLADSRGEKAAEPLRLIGETGRQALDDLRRVLGVLRDEGDDPQLQPQPGIADLDRLLPSVRAAGLTVVYHTMGEPHRLGPGRQLAVYRIVQEALTNTLKHAGPGAGAEVTVAAGPGEVRVRVTDSGPAGPRPADVDGASGSHGLVGIRERAGLYGGTVSAGPGPGGHGWVVDVVMTAPEPVEAGHQR